MLSLSLASKLGSDQSCEPSRQSNQGKHKRPLLLILQQKGRLSVSHKGLDSRLTAELGACRLALVSVSVLLGNPPLPLKPHSL